MGAERLPALKRPPCHDTGPARRYQARGAVSVVPVWHARVTIRPAFVKPWLHRKPVLH